MTELGTQFITCLTSLPVNPLTSFSLLFHLLCSGTSVLQTLPERPLFSPRRRMHLIVFLFTILNFVPIKLNGPGWQEKCQGSPNLFYFDCKNISSNKIRWYFFFFFYFCQLVFSDNSTSVTFFFKTYTSLFFGC